MEAGLENDGVCRFVRLADAESTVKNLEPIRNAQTGSSTTATISRLAEEIHDATGMTGKELEAFTFLTAAVYADIVGRKDIGDYFQKRMDESWKQVK